MGSKLTKNHGNCKVSDSSSYMSEPSNPCRQQVKNIRRLSSTYVRIRYNTDDAHAHTHDPRYRRNSICIDSNDAPTGEIDRREMIRELDHEIKNEFLGRHRYEKN